ncbi:MAG: class I SAM-dependent methyltransferase, partial [Chloroflexota bacterium]
MSRQDTVWQDRELVKSFLGGVRGAIPLATEQIDMMLRVIVGFRGDNVRSFIDLGCGDGVLAQAMLATYPDAKAVLYDFSQPMLDAAVERLNDDDAVVIQGDYAPVGWVAALAVHTPFDVIVSGYSIHH